MNKIPKNRFFYEITKTLFDFSLCLLASILLTPIFLLIALLIKINSPTGPVVYKGERTSKDGGLFKLYKFRTMVPDAENLGGPSTALNDDRLTSIGRFLRRYKLDELPQLINVIKGDMSIVGPRPQVKFYTDLYTEDERQILSVKPGITDLSTLEFTDMDSILGEGDIDKKYREKIEPLKNIYRLDYVRKRSFKLDLIILIRTLFKLIS